MHEAVVMALAMYHTLVLWASLPGTKFLLLWDSSNTRQPSKSDPPAQSMTCCSRPCPLSVDVKVV